MFVINTLKRLLPVIISMLFIVGASAIALGAEWEPVTGKEALSKFMSGTTLKWEEGGGQSWGEYRADGTGTLHAWDASSPRTWEVKGDDQVCVTAGNVTECWQLEKNSADPNLYRSREIGTGKMTEIRMSSDSAVGTIQGDPKAAGDKGGAAAPSANEMAAQLANPTSPVANMTFRNQFFWYEGDLPVK